MSHDVAFSFHRKAARIRPLRMLAKVFPMNDLGTKRIQCRSRSERLQKELGQIILL